MRVAGGQARLTSLEVYQLKSIWWMTNYLINVFQGVKNGEKRR
jgi:hypothetical protein